jgi:hypothetical protein
MNDKPPAEQAGPMTSASEDRSDPDRMPDVQLGAKRLSLRDVIAFEKAKAKAGKPPAT